MATLGDTFLLDRQPFWLRHFAARGADFGGAPAQNDILVLLGNESM
jgi:hypothetical protein